MTNIDTLSVSELQKALSDFERDKLDELRQALRNNLISREDYNVRWQAIGAQCAVYQKRLFALTGDAYGKPKRQAKARPGDDVLLAPYASPEQIPASVRSWLRQHAGTLTADATDAVRWMRIVDTLKDERYPAGDLTIYRAVEGDEIRPGDWVTTDRAYAEDHCRRYLGKHAQVLEEVVDGRDVLVSPTGNPEEAIYAPRNFSGPVRNLEMLEMDDGLDP